MTDGPNPSECPYGRPPRVSTLVGWYETELLWAERRSITPMAVPLTLGRRPIACVLPVACAALLVLLGLAPVHGATLIPSDNSAIPSGIGAGVYFVSWSGDYQVGLTQVRD